MYALRFNNFKNFVIVFIVIFCILPLVFCVQSYAVTSRSTLTEDNSAYDFCLNEGYDSLKDAYKYRYRCYNAGGCWEGTFYISSSIHDSTDKSYVLWVTNEGKLDLFQANKKIDYFKVDDKYISGRWYLCFPDSIKLTASRYFYNSDNDSFYVTSNINDAAQITISKFSPDGILLTNTDVKYARYDLSLSSFQ